MKKLADLFKDLLGKSVCLRVAGAHYVGTLADCNDTTLMLVNVGLKDCNGRDEMFKTVWYLQIADVQGFGVA